jgi:hypothetical protein
MKNYILIITALALALFFVSCEKDNSGTTDVRFESPYLLDVTLSHSTLNLDSDTTGSITALGNNRYRISIGINGHALPNSSPGPWSGTVSIFKPGSSYSSSEHTITLHGSDTLTFSDSLQFTVTRSDWGNFRIECSVRSGAGQTGGGFNTTLSVTRQNSQPIIRSITAPDTIIRPTTGYQLLFFAIAVTDSDGYSDIQNVYLKRISPTETDNIYLFDDGMTALDGDDIAGDGVFSRILSIDATARLGDQVFLFRAMDRSGALSDSTTRTITIIPE